MRYIHLLVLGFLLSPLELFAVGVGGPIVCSKVFDIEYHATEWYYDHDGDGAVEQTPTIWLCGNEELPNVKSFDPVGVSGLTHAPPEAFDCAPGDPLHYQSLVVYGPDADGDGYPATVGPEMRICAGLNKNPTLKLWDLQGMGDVPFQDCNDNDITVPIGPVYLDSDGDGAVDDEYSSRHCTDPSVAGKPYVSQYVPGIVNGYPAAVEASRPVVQDCAIHNPAIRGGMEFYEDRDGDGWGAGEPIRLCGKILDDVMSEADAPQGYTKKKLDCNDNNPQVNESCTLKWNWDAYYPDDTKRKIIIAQPYANYGFGFDVDLRKYVIYDGDDAENLKYEVKCNFCKDPSLSGSVYTGPIVAADKKEFFEVAGRRSVEVKVTNKLGNTATAKVDLEIVTGQALVFVNGINTKLFETKEGNSCGTTDDNGKCNFGAYGAIIALREFMRDKLLPLVPHNSETYLKFDFAFNPTRWGGMHDVLLECLQAKLADLKDNEILIFRKSVIELSKFGNDEEFELKFPGFLSETYTKLLNKAIQSLSTENIPLDDYRKVYQKLEQTIRSGYRVTLVSHSQGNFMANQAYADLNEAQKSYVNQLQVATPASYNADGSNRYVSLVLDPVAALALPTRVQNAVGTNVELCHNFLECYLGQPFDSGLDSARMISDYIVESFNEFRSKFDDKAGQN